MGANVARKHHTNISESPTGVGRLSKTDEQEALGKYTVSFGLSVAITSVLSAVLVVVKELNENTILEWMKHATPHHWITHGVFDLVVFAALGFALARANGGKGLEVGSRMLNQLIVGAVAISCAVITGFYLLMG